MRGGFADERYPLSALTGRIIGAAQEVHRTLGPGFEEVIYQRALAKELPSHEVETKAKAALADVDFVQALSYLKASGYRVGLLINFGGQRLLVRRLAN